MNLQTMLEKYVKEVVAVQKKCNSCDGYNEHCDECKILRHKPIRQLLERAGVQLRKYDDTTEDDYGFKNSFLTGSCARKTGVRPPKDVDFFVVIDDAQYAVSNTRPDAKQLLINLEQLLQSILKTEVFGHKITEVKAQKRSVNIMFDDEIGVDVIPAFHAPESTSSQELFEIADEDLGYIKSNPKVHAELLRGAVAAEKLPALRDAIRLIRKWRNSAFEESDEKPKSFHLEMVAIQLFSTHFPNTLHEALDLYFQGLPIAFEKAQMPDPAYSASEQIKQCWIDAYVDELSPEGKKNILSKIANAKDLIADIKQCEYENKMVQVSKKIRELYPDFPTQEVERTFEVVKKRAEQSKNEHAGTRTSSGSWSSQ